MESLWLTRDVKALDYCRVWKGRFQPLLRRGEFHAHAMNARAIGSVSLELASEICGSEPKPGQAVLIDPILWATSELSEHQAAVMLIQAVRESPSLTSFLIMVGLLQTREWWQQAGPHSLVSPVNSDQANYGNGQTVGVVVARFLRCWADRIERYSRRGGEQ